MKRIGLLSDTHNYFHKKIFEFFIDCDEIWHAGDIGSLKLADKINRFKPLRAVFGNMDGQDVRIVHPKELLFNCEEVKVYMIHIGGYPGKYDRNVRETIVKNRPGLFICGHSHILKVMYDKNFNLLHMNPGSAGRQGIHQKCTMLRFIIDGKDIKDLEVLELEK